MEDGLFCHTCKTERKHVTWLNDDKEVVTTCTVCRSKNRDKRPEVSVLPSRRKKPE